MGYESTIHGVNTVAMWMDSYEDICRAQSDSRGMVAYFCQMVRHSSVELETPSRILSDQSHVIFLSTRSTLPPRLPVLGTPSVHRMTPACDIPPILALLCHISLHVGQNVPKPFYV